MSQERSQPRLQQEQRLGATVHEINLMVARLFNRRVRDIGLTRAQWQIIYLLNGNDGLTQTEIAERLVMAKAPLGKIVDRLENDGWVQRRDDASDRRVKRVFITDSVPPLIEPVSELVDEISERAMRGISAAERRKLFALLSRIHGNLSEVVSG